MVILFAWWIAFAIVESYEIEKDWLKNKQKAYCWKVSHENQILSVVVMLAAQQLSLAGGKNIGFFEANNLSLWRNFQRITIGVEIRMRSPVFSNVV